MMGRTKDLWHTVREAEMMHDQNERGDSLESHMEQENKSTNSNDPNWKDKKSDHKNNIKK